MEIRRANKSDKAEWVRMRAELWPDSPDDHPPDVDRYFESSGNQLATFVADNEQGGICGFVEAGTRPYAEGCNSSPVAYIEGWWVEPGFRKLGVGRALIAAAEEWARSLGMTELASDAELDNVMSIDAHRSLGFREVERIVCFRKAL